MLIMRSQNNFRNIIFLYIISFLFCSAITLSRMMLYDYYLGFNLLPITILGGLFLGSLLKTILIKDDVFSPFFIYYFFGCIFFYWAPLNQILWDFWPSLNANNMDFWVSIWGWFCLLGFFLVEISSKIIKKNKTNIVYSLNKVKFTKIFYILSVICLISQAVVLIKFGGLSGIISAYEMRVEEGIQGFNPYAGYGFLFTFSESYPNILAIYLIAKFRDDDRFKLLRYFLIYMVFMFVVNMIFGGLRGSRSTTIWSLFWAAAIYHFMVTRISYRLMLVGVFVVSAFMSTYSLYKFGGVEGLKGLYDSEVKTQIYESRYISDSDKLIIVRDTSRADVQSYVIRDFFKNETDMAYGRTLVAGAIAFVPSFLLPIKPDTFVREKTEIFIGKSYFSENTYTTLLTGLYGEFSANFGPIIGLVYFILFGYYIGWLSHSSKNLNKNDSRRYLIPVLLLCVIQFMMSDSNVISQFLFRYLLLPGILIYFSSYKRVSNETNSFV